MVIIHFQKTECVMGLSEFPVPGLKQYSHTDCAAQRAKAGEPHEAFQYCRIKARHYLCAHSEQCEENAVFEPFYPTDSKYDPSISEDYP